jgi:hypothetical protein
MFSGTAGICLTSISYFLLGKIGILKTEAKVARAYAIRFPPQESMINYILKTLQEYQVLYSYMPSIQDAWTDIYPLPNL